MLKVVLTGGLASGKSTVLRHLDALGAATCSADAIAHALLLRGSSVFAELASAFGEACVTPTGMNRAALAARVFSNPSELQRLNAILHPEVRREIAEFYRKAETDGVRIAVAEIPLFAESEGPYAPDVVVTVEVSSEVSMERAIARGMEAEDARLRMQSQVSTEVRKALADWVIPAEGSEADVSGEVQAFWGWLQSKLTY